jgi:hypothetical protein
MPETDKRRRSTVAGRGSRRVFRLREAGIRRSVGRGIGRDGRRRRHVIGRAVPRPRRHSKPDEITPSHDPTTYSPADRSRNGRTHAPQGRRFCQAFRPFAAAPHCYMHGMPYRRSAKARRRAFSEEPQPDDEAGSDGCLAVCRRIGRCSLRRFGR